MATRPARQLTPEEIRQILEGLGITPPEGLMIPGAGDAPTLDQILGPRPVPYPEIPADWRNVVPPSPGGGISYSGDSTQPDKGNMGGGGAPPPPQAPPPTSTSIPVKAQPPGVTGGTLPGVTGTPIMGGTIVAPKASTSFLSQWLAPLITAGAGLGGAWIQKSAADNATDAQTEAADKSLALTERMYEQDRADYAPYRNLGAFSLSQLGHLVGMPPDFGTQAVQAATQPRTAIPRVPEMVARPAQPPTDARQRRPLESDIALLGRPEFQRLRDLGASQQTASSFVRMRAPDGEEADIDPREAAFFEAHGAQRI